MFNRSLIVLMSITSTVGIALPSVAGSLGNLFEPKSQYSGPVATRVVEFKDHFNVAALAFSGDGTQLAANFLVDDDGVHLWRWRDSPPTFERLVKPAGAGDGRALGYSPDGSLLAVRHDNSRDNKVLRIWNAKTGQVVHDIVESDKANLGDNRGLAFTPDGKLLIRAVARNIYEPGEQLFAYRTDTWELVWKLRTMPFQPDLLAMSPDGKLLAMGGLDNFGQNTPPIIKIAFLDIANRQIVRSINAPFPRYVPPSALAWSPDGLHIAVGCRPGDFSPGPDFVKIIDAASGKPVASVPAKSGEVTGLTYTPDGRYLIAGSIDNSARIMDGRNYTLLQSIPGNWNAVAVSRDSRYLAVSEFPKISIWMLK
jgi:WD40 repeat protein